MIGIFCYIFCAFIEISIVNINFGFLILIGILLGIGNHGVSNVIPAYVEEFVERDSYFDMRSAEAIFVYLGALVGGFFWGILLVLEGPTS